MTMRPCHTHGIDWSHRHQPECPLCALESELRAAKRERERQQREIRQLRERISAIEDRLGEPPAEVVVVHDVGPVAADGSGSGERGEQ